MKCYLCGATKNKDGTPIKYRICKTCNNKKAQQYYLKNSKKLKQRSRLWKKRNKEKVIEMSKRYRAELKIQALKAYSNNEKIKCICCRETEIDFLCLDHINNDGTKHRKKLGIRGSREFCVWLIKNNFPKDIQVLCYNCNNIKSFYGYTKETYLQMREWHKKGKCDKIKMEWNGN